MDATPEAGRGGFRLPSPAPAGVALRVGTARVVTATARVVAAVPGRDRAHAVAAQAERKPPRPRPRTHCRRLESSSSSSARVVRSMLARPCTSRASTRSPQTQGASGADLVVVLGARRRVCGRGAPSRFDAAARRHVPPQEVRAAADEVAAERDVPPEIESPLARERLVSAHVMYYKS